MGWSPARGVFGVASALVVIALALQIPHTATHGEEFFTTPGARVANLFFYFTIVSNLLIASVFGRLAVNPRPLSRPMSAVAVAALANIVITGAVYHLMLAADNPTEGVGVVTDAVFHTAIPVVAVAAWLVFGFGMTVDMRVIGWSTTIPLAWLTVVLIRGELIGWYPYPFIDVAGIGYEGAALNIAGITVFFLGVAAAVLGVERALRRRISPRPAG